MRIAPDSGKKHTANSFVSVREIGNEAEITAPREHYFTLLFVEMGTGLLTIELKDYPVRPGQIHILIPGKLYHWKLDGPAKGYLLTISKDMPEMFPPFFQFIFFQYDQPPIPDLDMPTFKKALVECLAIKEELSAANVSLELVNARCLLITLIISLWRHGRHGDMLMGNAHSIAHSFKVLVDENFRKHKTVSFYAARLCITPNYLGIICRKSFNKSALEIIQERVLHEAKQLLHSTRKSVKEIAFDIGFPKLTYFSYFFRSKTNLTPMAYRKLFERSVKLSIEN